MNSNYDKVKKGRKKNIGDQGYMIERSNLQTMDTKESTLYPVKCSCKFPKCSGTCGYLDKIVI